MRQDVKTKWVEALRSGKYNQERGALKVLAQDDEGGKKDVYTKDGYCCLGVLCDLAEQEGVITGVVQADGAVMYPDPQEDQSDYLEGGILPTAVMQWAGLDRQNPAVSHNNHGLHTLAHYNDTLLFNFEGIADLVEEQL